VQDDTGAIRCNINDQGGFFVEDQLDSVDDQMNLSDDSAISSISAVSSSVGHSSENVRLRFKKKIIILLAYINLRIVRFMPLTQQKFRRQRW